MRGEALHHCDVIYWATCLFTDLVGHLIIPLSSRLISALFSLKWVSCALEQTHALVLALMVSNAVGRSVAAAVTMEITLRRTTKHLSYILAPTATAAPWNTTGTCPGHISPQNQRKEPRNYSLHKLNKAYFRVMSLFVTFYVNIFFLIDSHYCNTVFFYCIRWKKSVANLHLKQRLCNKYIYDKYLQFK